jgi:hypothetical protein
LAGNVMTTNFNYTVDYSGKTNPPTFALNWPQSGTQVSGSSFTMVGLLADYTATVTATLTDTNGVTNSYQGVVERDGTFWLDNVQLSGVTNVVTLTFVDAAGNLATTNITVYQSEVVLTMDAPDPASLWQPTIDASGTISSDDIDTSDYTVWVNGVEVTNDGYGDWYGTVPVNPGGVADFNLTAYPPGDNPDSGGGGSGTGDGSGGGWQNPPDTNAISEELNLEKPVRVYVANDEQQMDLYEHMGLTNWATEDISQPPTAWMQTVQTNHYGQAWAEGLGGTGSSFSQYLQWSSDHTGDSTYTCAEQMTWPTNNWPWLDNGLGSFTGNDCGSSDTNIGPEVIGYAGVFGESCNVSDPVPAQPEIGWNNGWYTHYYYSLEYDQTYVRHAQTEMKLATGGRAVPGHKSLIQISGVAYGILDKRWTPEQTLYGGSYTNIPPETVTVGTFGNLDTNGNLYVLLPDGDPDIKVVAPNEFYIYSVGVTKYRLSIKATTNGVANFIDDVFFSAPEFCVGQQITFSPHWDINPYTGTETPPYSHATADWTLPGTFVNEQPYPATCDAFYDENTNLLHQDSSTNSALSTACWYVKDFKGGKASLAMNLDFNGQMISLTESGPFDVYRPKTSFVPTYHGTPQVVATNGVLTLRHHDMSFKHYIQSDFPGVAGYVQLVNGSWLTDPEGIPLIGTELDGKLGDFPRGTPSINPTLIGYSIGAAYFYDAPSLPLSDNATTTEEKLEFSTYLMFKPNGSGNIFVPLRLVNWELNDAASPNSSGGWTPSGSATITGNTDNDTTTFPQWTRTYTGGF